MNVFRSSRRSRRIWLSLALVAPLFLTQCKTGGSYQDIDYDPATLKTPPGHGLEKKEYPFDDDGRYRKDWVRGNAQGRTRSSYEAPAAPAEEASASSESPAGSSGGDYPNYQDLAASSAPSPPSPSAATSSEPRYHRVSSGDTLYSLSRRYGTSVDALKRTNGLTSDSIRTGQTLRIP